jgi:hypothetical protein
VDEENFNKVENLSTLRVSAVFFLSGEVSPEKRNVASYMPDWAAEDVIIPADDRGSMGIT